MYVTGRGLSNFFTFFKFMSIPFDFFIHVANKIWSTHIYGQLQTNYKTEHMTQTQFTSQSHILLHMLLLWIAINILIVALQL